MRRWILLAVLLLALPMAASSESDDEDDSPPEAAPVRSATLILKIPDFESAREAILKAALRHQAVLMHAETQVNPKGKKHGWLKFRLSSPQFFTLLPELRATGKIYSEHMSTEDRASECQETALRRERLKEHEQRLEGILQNSRRLRDSDILFIQERLYRASLEEATLEQKHTDIERGMQDTSLQVLLFEPGSLPPSPDAQIDIGGRFSSSLAFARNYLNQRLARAATGAAYTAVLSPFWLPALLAAVLLAWWLGRKLGRWLRRVHFHLVPERMSRYLGSFATAGVGRLTHVLHSRKTRFPHSPTPADDPDGKQ